ncbi:hypothetical protein SDC9_187851 [bioreactor metagenome]|uniref:Uncharacterized protein n=1 Tax=bioreactor metagenome TaxID=1076179 RepID=A0A645HMP0_9ZZZZ
MRKMPKGMHEDAIEVTKNLLRENVGMDQIGAITGLKPEEVQEIQRKNNIKGIKY